MATVEEVLIASHVPAPDGRVLLRGVSWSTYESLLRDIGDANIRLTYDRGDLEIMSPSIQHEGCKRRLGRMIEAMTEELDVPIRSVGSTTWKRQAVERGLEADECYYVTNELEVRGRDDIDLESAPPPDLAIEIEATRSSINKLSVYSALGIPEVWTFDGERLTFLVRQEDGVYAHVGRSAAFPFISPADLQPFLAQRRDVSETTWIRGFRQWVREHLLHPPT